MLTTFLNDLEELVNIDSGTGNSLGVARIASQMSQHLRSMGLTTQTVDLGPTVGPALFATNHPEATHYDLLMNAHMDTVFEDGTARERPFSTDAHKAYGPGVSDCKSGLLAIVHSLRLTPPEVLSQLNIAVALTPDEEIGSIHSSAWLSSIAKKADYALIFEAARADGTLVKERMGRASFSVSIEGQSEHVVLAKSHEHDANRAAIDFATRAFALCENHSELNLTLTTMRGGEKINFISSQASLCFDVRFWNNDTFVAFERAFLNLVTLFNPSSLKVSIHRDSHGFAMQSTPKAEKLFSLLQKATHKEGLLLQYKRSLGGSDANQIASTGIATIDGCGPVGSNFHTKDEYLLLDELPERIQGVSRFYALLLEQKNQTIE